MQSRVYRENSFFNIIEGPFHIRRYYRARPGISQYDGKDFGHVVPTSLEVWGKDLIGAPFRII